MKSRLFAAAILAFATANLPHAAHAVGCVSGAAVGAVAGHVAGHHAGLGAAGGCAVGHYENLKQKRGAAATNAQPAPTTQQ